jgi:lactam utilization protein B
VAARSICIHGDGPNAAAMLALIRAEVIAAGVTLAAAA